MTLDALRREFFPSESVFYYMEHVTPLEDLVALKSLAGQACKTPNATVVEVGSWAGLTARAILKEPAVKRLYCIDHWGGNLGEQSARYGGMAFATFCRNMKDHLYERLIPLIGHSALYASVWPDKSLSMVFIDANHEYEHVKADIKSWYPKLIDGGVFAGHDYGILGLEGVKAAVDELLPGVEVFGKCVWAVRKNT